jgi:hypothetical protein
MASTAAKQLQSYRYLDLDTLRSRGRALRSSAAARAGPDLRWARTPSRSLHPPSSGGVMLRVAIVVGVLISLAASLHAQNSASGTQEGDTVSIIVHHVRADKRAQSIPFGRLFRSPRPVVITCWRRPGCRKLRATHTVRPCARTWPLAPARRPWSTHRTGKRRHGRRRHGRQPRRRRFAEISWQHRWQHQTADLLAQHGALRRIFRGRAWFLAGVARTHNAGVAPVSFPVTNEPARAGAGWR